MLNMAYDYAKNFNPRTPAKECDDQSVQHRSPSFYFNPRTPAKECDIPDSMEIHCVDRFQSTHPREGVRRFCLSITTIISYFNPRTPAKECDGLAVTLGLFCWNFNPRTPAKECDLASFQSFSLPSRISIHAPPRRSATAQDDYHTYGLVFQSTHPREGVRHTFIREVQHFDTISIHAPPRRSATHA